MLDWRGGIIHIFVVIDHKKTIDSREVNCAEHEYVNNTPSLQLSSFLPP